MREGDECYMSIGGGSGWPTAREFHEAQMNFVHQVDRFTDKLDQIEGELERTRADLKKYNGLRAELSKVCNDVSLIQNSMTSKRTVGKDIRDWGGWITSILLAGRVFGWW